MGQTFLVNVTGNYLLARQTEWVFKDQRSAGCDGADKFRQRCSSQERQRGL